MLEFCASILAADFARLDRDIAAAEAAGINAFHIDVMDGHFVPAISFGSLMVRTMRGLTARPLDVHLMVETPLQFVKELAEIGADRVSVHREIPGGPGPALAAIRAAGMKAGLVLNPETPPEAAAPYLPLCDQLLVMTVQPGRGGQAYLAGSNAKIAALHTLLRQAGSAAVIQVDGGINTTTLPQARAAGAGSFIMGSAVFKGDIGRNLQALREIVKRGRCRQAAPPRLSKKNTIHRRRRAISGRRAGPAALRHAAAAAVRGCCPFCSVSSFSTRWGREESRHKKEAPPAPEGRKTQCSNPHCCFRTVWFCSGEPLFRSGAWRTPAPRWK